MERVQARRSEARNNRSKFFGRISLPNIHIDWIRPTQSPNIEIVNFVSDSNQVRRTEYLTPPKIDTDYDFYNTGVDGVLTFDKNIAVALISGDCVPLVVWDNDSKLHGIIHIGILGALNGVARSLEILFKEFKIDASHLHAYLGPSISRINYDVTRSGLWEAIKPQVLKDKILLKEIEPYYDGVHFDVRGLIGAQLSQTGFCDQNIEYFEQCTASKESPFYSHYAAVQDGEEPHNFCSIICPKV